MLNAIKIAEEIEKRGYVEIRIKNGLFTIEPRPAYCNRGEYFVKIFPDPDQFDLHIDEQDMFPRYYFYLLSAILETEAWIVKNKQGVSVESQNT